MLKPQQCKFEERLIYVLCGGVQPNTLITKVLEVMMFT